MLLPLLLSVVLLYLAFRGVDWARLIETLRQGQPERVGLACMIVTVSYVVRGLRWRLLLSGKRQIAPATVVWASMAGNLGNFVLPARAGEIVRSVLLGRRADLSASYVLATALLERLVDVVALVVITLLALTSLGTVPGWLLTAARGLAALGLLGLVGLLFVRNFDRLFPDLFAHLPVPARLRSRVVALTSQFMLGLGTLRAPRQILGFAALTAIIWLLDVSVAMTVGQAFGLPLEVPQAMLLLAALGLASAVPSTPGYVGIYQFVAVTVLVPLGFSRDQALAQVITLQAVVFGVIIVLGTLGLWRLSGVKRAVAWRELRASPYDPIP
jgi:glycosyltransferase 2 family protein